MSEPKTLDEVYHDRNVLALGFTQMTNLAHRLMVKDHPSSPVHLDPFDYRAGWHLPTDEDDADAAEWAVVFAMLPAGQVSWHIPRSLAEESALARKYCRWDGHTREMKNARLLSFAGKSVDPGV